MTIPSTAGTTILRAARLWATLDPQLKATLKSDGRDLTAAIQAVQIASSAGLRTRIGVASRKKLGKRRALALNPEVAVGIAQHVLAMLLQHPRVTVAELAQSAGLDSGDDRRFREALELLQNDGLATTDETTSGTDTATVRFKEAAEWLEGKQFLAKQGLLESVLDAIIERISSDGILIGRKVLQALPGKLAQEDFDVAWQAAVATGLRSSVLEWYGRGVLGLPRATLRTFDEPAGEEKGETLTTAVSRLAEVTLRIQSELKRLERV